MDGEPKVFMRTGIPGEHPLTVRMRAPVEGLYCAWIGGAPLIKSSVTCAPLPRSSILLLD